MTALSARRGSPPAALAAAVLLITVITSLPLIYLLLRVVETGPRQLGSEVARARIGTLLANTGILAVSVTLAAMIIGLAAAWCVERSDLPGRRAWRILLCLPLAVPAFVASYAWSSLSGAFGGMGGAILILTLCKYPLVMLPAAAALRGSGGHLEDISRTLGHGAWGTFARITLPLLRPALGGGALLVLSHMLAEFGALSLLRVQTFTTAIFDAYQLQFDNATAASLSGILVALCLPAAFGEMFARARLKLTPAGQGGGRRRPPVRLGLMAPVITVLLILLTLLALGVPLFTLIYWLMRGSSAGLGLEDLWPAIRGSLSLSLPGAVIVTLIAFPIVRLTSVHRSASAMLADRIPYIVHSLPALVVALSLVFMSLRFVPELYQTRTLLFAAYATLFLPLAQSALRASSEQLSPNLEAAARTLGWGPIAAFLRIGLPNLAPGLAAAFSLSALELMRELSATLILAPTGVTPLATEVWSRANDAQYAAAAPYAAILVAVSAIPVYVFARRSLTATERVRLTDLE
ncbi:iron ABC transporter permease [soil metagenome]